ncbi:hypothetical protein [Dyadobacter sp. LHD-138]|nr:hypothetical protein [Dyadobacter sp. LHD-138]MDQ6477833.1 hypothetical protein [Dyadobacter sp. LHD-138]
MIKILNIVHALVWLGILAASCLIFIPFFALEAIFKLFKFK